MGSGKATKCGVAACKFCDADQHCPWAATFEDDMARPLPEETHVGTPINPSHYTDGGIETWDFIAAKLSHEEQVGACKANVLKYISRMGKKGDAATDAQKARWYLTRLCELLDSEKDGDK